MPGRAGGQACAPRHDQMLDVGSDVRAVAESDGIHETAQTPEPVAERHRLPAGGGRDLPGRGITRRPQCPCFHPPPHHPIDPGDTELGRGSLDRHRFERGRTA